MIRFVPIFEIFVIFDAVSVCDTQLQHELFPRASFTLSSGLRMCQVFITATRKIWAISAIALRNNRKHANMILIVGKGVGSMYQNTAFRCYFGIDDLHLVTPTTENS